MPHTEIIEEVKQRFADLMDNDNFGPWLEEGSQFNDERYNILFKHSIGRINSRVMWPANFTVETYPYDSSIFHTAIVYALIIEVIRHFMTSYVEQPNVSSVGTPIADRRDYYSRWESMLKIYEKDFDDSINAIDKKRIQDAGTNTSVIVGYSSRFGGGGLYPRPYPRYWRGF